jgi:hypothetical protein
MRKTRIKTREQARQKAIDWQIWAAERSMSYADLIKWNEYFTELAKKFRLKTEFKENGII